jgi:hypothetical protein
MNTTTLQLVLEAVLLSYSTKKKHGDKLEAKHILLINGGHLSAELHEYSVYGAIFKIMVIFWRSYFGQNGVESTAYYRRHLHHINSNRNSIRLLSLFTNLDKKIQLSVFMDL